MQNNQLIIDERNTGKTTYLLSEIGRLIKNNVNIIIMDSATEHEDKSLLKRVEKEYKDSIVIDMKDPTQIVIDKMDIIDFVKNFMDYFPFKDVCKNKNKLICFDLSYFLEKGYEIAEKTNSKELYNYYRKLYNSLSQQIAVSLILMEKYGIINNSVVVMDEIEFPIVNYDIGTIQDNLSFLASVHPENAFGTFYTTFDRLNFIPYVKKRKG